MKRSPLARKSPLGRGHKRVSPVNRERKAERYARDFGEEAQAVREMACLACTSSAGLAAFAHAGLPRLAALAARSEPAHVTSRGAGGGRLDIVPLCTKHHAEQHLVGIQSFAGAYQLDLRAEADRIAASHEAPLGMRGLAQRWAHEKEQPGDEHYVLAPLDTYEREALLGWVRRRMGREVSQREYARKRAPLARKTEAAVGAPLNRFGCVWDDLDEADREALAYTVATDLHLDDPHGEHGIAWDLCELAGWPS